MRPARRYVQGAAAFVLAAAVLAFTQLPVVWAMRSDALGHQPDRTFTGALPTYAVDTVTYWAWIRQAAEGRFLFEDRYTTESHPRTYVNVFFWTLGTVAGATGADVVVVYNTARVVLGALLLALLWGLAKRAFPRPGERLACYFLLLVSGGFEGVACWLERNHGGPHVSSPSWWMPELSTTFSLMLFPHFLAAFAAMLGGLFLALRAWSVPGDRRTSGRDAAALGAGGVLVVLTFFHPYDALTLGGTLWASVALFAAMERRLPRRELRATALATAVWLPALAWNFLLFRGNPAMRAWDEQVAMPSPEPGRLVLALGACGVLAAVAVVALPRLRRVHLVMVGWVLASLVLAYLPFRFQRRMLAGIQFPVAVLAVAAAAYVLVPLLTHAARRLGPAILRLRLQAQGRVGWGTIALVLALVPLQAATPWYVQDIEWTELRRVKAPSWLRDAQLDALRALDAAAGPDAVVLASPALGNYVPALAGARCLVGHYGLTIAAERKARWTERFYAAPAGDDPWRRSFVARWGITHVLVTPSERRPGGFDADRVPWLRRLASFGEGESRSAVYAVIARADLDSPGTTGVGSPPDSASAAP